MKHFRFLNYIDKQFKQQQKQNIYLKNTLNIKTHYLYYMFLICVNIIPRILMFLVFMFAKQ